MEGRFAGDVEPRQAWQALVQDPRAVLLDVRTRAEWTYVGTPDLSSLERPLFRVEWQFHPTGERNKAFADEVVALGIRPDQPVYLLCRSGVRSKAAAELLAALGYTTYNVADGFEGQLDASGHRGARGGWKHGGLPWKQG